MSQGDQDKTEQPTPFRLEEARKRGEVAKSADVSGTVIMIVFACVIGLTGAGVSTAIALATARMIMISGEAPALNDVFLEWISETYAPVWQSLTPLLLGLMVTAVVGHAFQTGPIFTMQPLKPDFNRMNPAQTIKRIFSMRTLWELGKLSLKFALLTVLCVIFVVKGTAFFESIATAIPERSGTFLQAAFVKASICVLVILSISAVADLLFTRREYMRKMRMSRRELKDEVKRRDGDPLVKSKQKQQLRELLKKARAISRIPTADVVLTNPTHVAIALRYRPGETLAPIVVAKGAGLLSRRMRTIAARHRVPIMRSPKLARALYGECEIDGMIPVDHYAALAPIYRELWASKKAGNT